MEQFLSISLKLLPLYLMIFLGFIAGKKLRVEKLGIARLLIYILSPGLIFYASLTVPLSLSNLSLPLILCFMAILVSLLFYHFGKRVFGLDARKNILAFSAGTGNTGYFGLPLVLSILGEDAFKLAVLSTLGFIMYENTLGFYLSAKGKHSSAASLKKVLQLPSFYAFCLGLLAKLIPYYFTWDIGAALAPSIETFKAAYTLLGMMLIGLGLGLGNFSRAQLDLPLLGLLFLAKFAVWPLIILLFALLDSHFFNFYPKSTHQLLMLLSLVPLAANCVALAEEFDSHPEQVALAVLLSTLFALLYIPVMLGLLL